MWSSAALVLFMASSVRVEALDVIGAASNYVTTGVNSMKSFLCNMAIACPDEGEPCHADMPCISGLTCIKGFCSGCGKLNPCPAEHFCLRDRCLRQLPLGAPCAKHEHCKSGRCKNLICKACHSAADCEFPQFCDKAGWCVDCVENAHCKRNKVCKQGRCERLICPTGPWDVCAHKCYRRFSAQRSWKDAALDCVAQGARLAAPTSAEELLCLTTAGGSSMTPQYLAFNNLEDSGVWRDTLGRPLPPDAPMWAGMECSGMMEPDGTDPRGSPGREVRCTTLEPDLSVGVSDASCHRHLQYTCQIDFH